MITTLAELEAYTKQIGARFPDEAANTILSGPGIMPKERESLLKRIPGLPDSYLQCAERFNLHGIRSGYFAFWPEAFDAGNMVGSLTKASSEVNPYWVMFGAINVLQVASWEADPIVVALKDSSEPDGSVLKFSEGNPKAPAVNLAQSFEMFLLLVGNLDQVANEAEGQRAVDVFQQRFEFLVPTPNNYWQGWHNIAQVVFL